MSSNLPGFGSDFAGFTFVEMYMSTYIYVYHLKTVNIIIDVQSLLWRNISHSTLFGTRLLRNKGQNICIIPSPSTRLSTSTNLFSLSTEMHRKWKDWHQHPARTNALLLRLVFGRKQILEKGDLFAPILSFPSICTLTRSILWTIYSKHNSKIRNRRATLIIWK